MARAEGPTQQPDGSTEQPACSGQGDRPSLDQVYALIMSQKQVQQRGGRGAGWLGSLNGLGGTRHPSRPHRTTLTLQAQPQPTDAWEAGA